MTRIEALLDNSRTVGTVIDVSQKGARSKDYSTVLCKHRYSKNSSPFIAINLSLYDMVLIHQLIYTNFHVKIHDAHVIIIIFLHVYAHIDLCFLKYKYVTRVFYYVS